MKTGTHMSAAWTLAATLTGLTLALNQVNADPITIDNHSFETPDLVTDRSSAISGATWRRVGDGSDPLGLDAIGLAKRVGTGTFATILDPTPDPDDAEQALYLNGSSESVFQVLVETLQANTTYTLTVDAGDRDDLDFQACALRMGTVSDPSDSADFGQNLLAATVVSNAVPLNGAGAADGWETWVTTFTTGAGVVGDQLRVEIATTGGIQSWFDNVRLEAEPDGFNPFAITEIEYDPDAEQNPTVTLTWSNSGAATYIAYLSRDLSDWGEDLDDSLTEEDDENTEDPEHITVTFPLEGDRADAEALFFRIEEG